MRTSGSTAMASPSAQTEAVPANTREEGKRGKIGLLAAVFSQLLGKAAQDDRAKNRATIPTVAPTETAGGHGSIQASGSEDKSGGDGTPARLASPGAPAAHMARATEQSHGHRGASDGVLTGAKNDSAEPADPTAHEGRSRSAEGRNTTIGAPATGTTATTVAAAAKAPLAGHAAESPATAELAPPQGQVRPATDAAAFSARAAAPVKSAATEQSSASGTLPILAKGAPTLSSVAAARYAQTADETQPLQASTPTASQPKPIPGDSRLRGKVSQPSSASTRESSPTPDVAPESLSARAAQGVAGRSAEAKAGDQRTYATELASGGSSGPKTAEPQSRVPSVGSSAQLGQNQRAVQRPQGSTHASDLQRSESVERSDDGLQKGSRPHARSTVPASDSARGKSSPETTPIAPAAHRPSDANASGHVLHDGSARPSSVEAKDRSAENHEQPRPTVARPSELPFLPYAADTKTPVSNKATPAAAASPINAAPASSAAASATGRLPVQSQHRQTSGSAPTAFAPPSDQTATVARHAAPAATTPVARQTAAHQTVASPSDGPVHSQRPAMPQRTDARLEGPTHQRRMSPQAAPSATPTTHAAATRQETQSPAPRGATQRSPQGTEHSPRASRPDLTATVTQTELPATPGQHGQAPIVAATDSVSPMPAPAPEATTGQRTSVRQRTKSEARPSSPVTASAQAERADGAKLEPMAQGPDRSHRQANPPAANQARPSSPAATSGAGSPAQPTSDPQPSPLASSKQPVGQEDLEPPTVRARTKRATIDGSGDAPQSFAPESSNKDSGPAANADLQAQPSAPAKAAAAPQTHAQHTWQEPAIASGRSAASESSPAQTAAPAAPSTPEQVAQAAPVALPTASPLPLITPPVAQAPNALPSAESQVKPVAVEAASIYQHAAEDAGLAITVLPHVAHLSLSSDDGNLSLHVRVRDGNADVNVGGSMAPIFESKAPEMRTVLAHQGLGLGSFAADQHGQGQHSQHRPDAPGSEVHHSHSAPSTRARATAVESTPTDEGRIHITA